MKHIILVLLLLQAQASYSKEYTLEITSGKDSEMPNQMLINGSSPGPTLNFKTGEDVVIRVVNKTNEDTSIHWHGLIVPSNQDGVPGLSFSGIRPNTTFTYRFTVNQSEGTYWYHSHSGLQEQRGVFGG